MGKGRPEGHHVVPAFYLRHFAVPGTRPKKIWQHEFNKEPLLLPVRNVGKRRHFYSTKTTFAADHDVTNELRLNEHESRMAPVVQQVITDQGIGNLSNDERVLFATFVVHCYVRTPRQFAITDMQYKDALIRAGNEAANTLDEDVFRKVLAQVKAAHPDFPDVSLWEAKEWMKDVRPKREEIKLTHSAGIKGMWMGTIIQLPILMQMQWKFWIPEDGEFITSDDPVVSTIDSPRGTEYVKGAWHHENVRVTFPLSPTLCFVATWKGGSGTMGLAKESVPTLNQRTAMMSETYVYATRSRKDVQPMMQQRELMKASSPEPIDLPSLLRSLQSPMGNDRKDGDGI